MPRIIPIRDLKNTAAVSQMCSESKEPVYITKNGYGDMVIMSMEAYEEKMQLLDAYAKLDAAEQQVEAGQTLDARSALQELRATLWHISWLKQPLHRQTWMRSCPTLLYRWKTRQPPQPLQMK
ncbi:MAG: type II toxin-antitoxin system Phd/YefM family antitoxin [Faecalibacterium sp.]